MELMCPRCLLPLTHTTYESIEVEVCQTCQGFWLDPGELEHILERRSLNFSAGEREQLLDGRHHGHTGPLEPAACPRCNKRMHQIHYDTSVHLILDECSEHGIWCDTGELKKTQVIAQQSEKIHRMLLAKLGLIEKYEG